MLTAPPHTHAVLYIHTLCVHIALNLCVQTCLYKSARSQRKARFSHSSSKSFKAEIIQDKSPVTTLFTSVVLMKTFYSHGKLNKVHINVDMYRWMSTNEQFHSNISGIRSSLKDDKRKIPSCFLNDEFHLLYRPTSSV